MLRSDGTIDNLLHHLWGKASAHPDYNKKEWQLLASFLESKKARDEPLIVYDSVGLMNSLNAPIFRPGDMVKVKASVKTKYRVGQIIEAMHGKWRRWKVRFVDDSEPRTVDEGDLYELDSPLHGLAMQAAED